MKISMELLFLTKKNSKNFLPKTNKSDKCKIVECGEIYIFFKE